MARHWADIEEYEEYGLRPPAAGHPWDRASAEEKYNPFLPYLLPPRTLVIVTPECPYAALHYAIARVQGDQTCRFARRYRLRLERQHIHRLPFNPDTTAYEFDARPRSTDPLWGPYDRQAIAEARRQALADVFKYDKLSGFVEALGWSHLVNRTSGVIAQSPVPPALKTWFMEGIVVTFPLSDADGYRPSVTGPYTGMYPNFPRRGMPNSEFEGLEVVKVVWRHGLGDSNIVESQTYPEEQLGALLPLEGWGDVNDRPVAVQARLTPITLHYTPELRAIHEEFYGRFDPQDPSEL